MSDKAGALTIEMVGGIRVVCPAHLSVMTSYVLMEQGDWFEDEIRFLRRTTRPDSTVVDVGASYGLYTLSLAKACPQGRVWSYEPCAETADYLRESLRVNGHGHVILTQKAASNRLGTGLLRTGENSELNALTQDDPAGERVDLTTLDTERAAQGWPAVDIVKLDAEGHELEVLEGGQEFFSADSPLVLLEIKAEEVNLEPCRWLMGRGYRPFRLIPGLWTLVPLDLEQSVDRYQLNVFCCKPDRIAALQADARLALGPSEPDERSFPRRGRWQRLAEQLPYAREHAVVWSGAAARGPADAADYVAVLDDYALARSDALPADVRYGALLAAYRRIEHLCRDGATPSRLLSYARIAADLGKRQAAVGTLFKAIGLFEASPDLICDEPFLSPSREFEQVSTRGALGRWTFAATLDGFERVRTFSGYFQPQVTMDIVNNLKYLGFCSTEMEVRGNLAASRLASPK